MGIIEDYLKSSKKEVEPATPVSSGIVEQYLKADGDKPKAAVKPPISGASKAQSDEINAEPSKSSTPNDTRNFPNPGGIIANKALSGLTTGLEGVGDILSNKPATGFGKIGMGAADTLFSIPSGVGEFIENLTGNKSLGDKISLIAGGAAPVKGAKAALNTYTGVKSSGEAFRKLVEDITPEKAGYVAREMRSNPNLTPADLSPSVRMGVQKLYSSVEGPHVGYLDAATNKRLDNASADLQQHMDANLGTTSNPVEKLAELKANIRDVGKEHINPAVAGSKPVDLTGTIKEIDNVLKPGVNSVVSHDMTIADPALEQQLTGIRKFLTDDKSIRTDPEQLNRIQSALRKKAELLEGKDPYIAGALYKVRDNIVEAIDVASGGKYRPALEKYRDEYHIQDAFEYGHDTILKNSKALSDRPENFENWIKSANDKELNAAREGARIAYDTQMNGFKHAARRGTDIGDVEFNKRRMSALFGKEEADKMFKVFEDAKKVADTNNRLTRSSETQRNNAQNSYFKPYEPDKAGNGGVIKAAVYGGLPMAAEAGAQFLTGGNSYGLGALATGAALGAGKAISAGASAVKTATIKKLNNERDMNYSKLALPVEPIEREALIKQLEAVANQSPKLGLKSKVRLALPTVSP